MRNSNDRSSVGACVGSGAGENQVALTTMEAAIAFTLLIVIVITDHDWWHVHGSNCRIGSLQLQSSSTPGKGDAASLQALSEAVFVGVCASAQVCVCVCVRGCGVRG